MTIRVTVLFARRQHRQLVADPQDAGGERPREAAKIEVGAVDVLYRQAHRVTLQLALCILYHIGRLQQSKQGFAFVPGQLVARVDHVVTVQRRDRHDMDGVDAELLANSRYSKLMRSNTSWLNSTRSILLTATTNCLMPSRLAIKL